MKRCTETNSVLHVVFAFTVQVMYVYLSFTADEKKEKKEGVWKTLHGLLKPGELFLYVEDYT